MESPKQINKKPEQTYFTLNNLLNIPKDNKIQLSKDKEAVKAYFLEHVNPSTMFFHTLKEKLGFLTENNYITPELLEKYNPEFVKGLFKQIYDEEFRFRSFMGAYKFYSQYALQTNNRQSILERYEDRLAFNALALADGDEEFATGLADELIHQRFQPATPTFLNIGRSRGGEKVSCFLLSVADNMNSIGRSINSALQLSKLGGGVAISLSNIRSNGDPIKGVEGLADGVVPIMKLYEDSFSYANQGGARDGAGAVYLSIFHPDIMEFLSVRKENADEKVRIKTLSLGVTVPDKFYELTKNDDFMYLFSPYDVEREYGIPFAYMDITKEYDNMVSNPNIRKSKIKARTLETEISSLQNESGYPYIMNIDTVNRKNPLGGRIIMSNLCVTGDTKLLTDKGYREAKELYDSQEDIKVVIDNRTKELRKDHKGTSVVDAIPMQLTARAADVYRVKTKQGFEITSTEWHKYYIKNAKGDIVKLPLAELGVGDRLLVQSGEGVFGNFHDTELAYLMGVIAGDGTYAKKDAARVYLYDNKRYLKEKIENIATSVIGRYLTEEETQDGRLSTEPKFTEAADGLLSMSSRALGRVLGKFGFNKETKTKYPTVLDTATKETVASYLSGLFQMDACVNANHKARALTIELTSIDKELVTSIQRTLLNLGVYSTIYSRGSGENLLPDGQGGKKFYKVKPSYKLSIQDRSSRERFMAIVEMKEYDTQKFNLLTDTLQTTSRKPKHDFTATIESIEYIGKEDVYDTTQPDFHSLIFNGVVTGNCTEILQDHEESLINDEQIFEIEGEDISCNLASTNVENLMDSPDLGKSVRLMLRALTYVADNSNIGVVPSVRNGNDKNHAVGLGAMNLHGYLAKNKIHYGSSEAIEFTDVYFMLLNYWTLVESNNIAKERNKTFASFKNSTYADGSYFDMYLNEPDFGFKHEKVKELFEGIFIPTHSDWKSLRDSIKEYGLYNSYRLATAPTGSISYINEATSSIHPIVQRIEERTEGKRGKVYYPAPHLSDETMEYYVSAYDMDQRKIIDMYAAAQKHVDQGMSLTLFLRAELPEGLYEWKVGSEHPTEKTTRDLNILRNYAWKNGIKTLYYIRTYSEDGEEVGANTCTNCSV